MCWSEHLYDEGSIERYMFNVIIDDEYLINDEGTSEGTQIKYKKEGFWYKKDNRGHQGLREYLAARFVSFTSY